MGYVRLGEVNIEGNVDNRLQVTCVVKGVDVRPMRNGVDSMVFIMKDKDVEYDARVFDLTDTIRETVKNGKVYDITIDVKTYDKGKGGISCIVKDIKESNLTPEAFSDWIDNFQVYYDKTSNLMAYISGTVCGDIACKVLTNNWEKFSVWPAAKGHHHTPLGGLLMHTACVAEKCYLDGEYYNNLYGKDFVNVKMLVSAALLHDVLKVKELDVDVGESKIDYSLESGLVPHVIGAAMEVRLAATELGLTDNLEVKELEHCILAHHGKLEWGSPVVPNTVEAHILHNADMIDAELWKFNKAFKGMAEHTRKVDWVRGEYKIFHRSKIGNNGLADI